MPSRARLDVYERSSFEIEEKGITIFPEDTEDIHMGVESLLAEKIGDIAKKIHVSVSKVYGVVTFYSYFTMEPKGQYIISVCMGTACFVRGSNKILERVEEILGIKNGETTSDGKFTITTLRCVGACGLAPVMQINDKTYGNITPEDVESILATY